MLTKMVIWSVVGSGLIIACLVGCFSFAANRAINQTLTRGRFGNAKEQRDPLESIDMHSTITTAGSGRWEFRFYPRSWPLLLIAIGALAIIAGLAFILHVPLPHSA